ncbi:Lrp/AsnC ligand binding domain-containing protein [Bacillus gaemokensis]|uniref:Lrp/AsnC ligand binding domain-containing protein n=1 Tax=Bacillus gaemokensis TaxID=574375 RepID=UPI00223662E8|nr:Lrp/AsnC ligand binding domain-containing protein [Bacillus gaemokensis]
MYTKALVHKPFLSFVQRQSCIENIYKISGDGCYLTEGFFSSHQELDEFLEELNTYANYKLSIVINNMKMFE